MLKQNRTHTTTQTIKDTLHIINTIKIQFQLQLHKLILKKANYTINSNSNEIYTVMN
jgi:hypothetical protein